MPFIWGKKSSVFDEVKLDMFYPPGIQLTRKDRYSLIWLASNYDPEKYKKVIPARDCEGADIVQICSSVANPVYPHALRLSAQLLLGTVRVYRTKARLLLQLAEQMMMKLSSLLKEASLRNAELNIIGIARPEAITMVDGCISIIDYSLEPVYYDPQMIMHMNEDDMIVLNSPFNSPVKVQKDKKQQPSTPKKAASSPLVVSNRQISITEDLLSPTRPIQVPGEDDFGPNLFGPAPDNFLADLDFEGFGRDNNVLPPVFEEEEHSLYNREEIDKKRRRLDDILIDDLGELSRELNNDEPVDLDKVLQDAISINFPTIDADKPPSIVSRLEEENTVAALSIADETSRLGIGLTEGSYMRKNKTVIGEPIDWEKQLETPADAIILRPRPSQPRKKRKLRVDTTTILSGQEIRENLANPENLIRMPISAGTLLSGAKELFERPVLIDLDRKSELKKWWDNNSACGSKSKKRRLSIEKPTSSEESDEFFLELPKSPEIARRDLDETPNSIGIPRAGSASLRSFEQSGGSTMLINQTPADDALSSRSLDTMLEIDEQFGDIQMHGSPRMSGIDILPDIIEADLNDAPPLDPIQENEQVGDETLVNEPLEPAEVERSFFTIGDDDDHLPKHLTKYQQKIMSDSSSTNSSENSMSFFDIFPHTSTRRRDATLAFYTCLNLTKNNFIDIEQKEVFGDIKIWKKST